MMSGKEHASCPPGVMHSDDHVLALLCGEVPIDAGNELFYLICNGALGCRAVGIFERDEKGPLTSCTISFNPPLEGTDRAVNLAMWGVPLQAHQEHRPRPEDWCLVPVHHKI